MPVPGVYSEVMKVIINPGGSCSTGEGPETNHIKKYKNTLGFGQKNR